MINIQTDNVVTSNSITAFEFRDQTADEASIRPLLAESLGNPSPDNLSKCVDHYRTSEDRLLCARVNGKIIGLIGIKNLGLQSHEILHLAVAKSARKQGVGRSLITFLLKNYEIKELIAETDDEAVAFYQRVGFDVLRTFENKWGVRRHQLSLKK